MQTADQRRSRRSVLLAATGGLAAVGLTACNLRDTSPQPPPAPDALLPLLTATIKLANRYDATITAAPSLTARLTPLRDAHRAHVVALAREMGLDERAPLANAPTPVASAASASAGVPDQSPPADPGAALAFLATAEKSAQAQAETACLAAPSYRAALLGSIAACRASHLEVLR